MTVDVGEGVGGATAMPIAADGGDCRSYCDGAGFSVVALLPKPKPKSELKKPSLLVTEGCRGPY